MTMPSLPPWRSRAWYAWAQWVHEQAAKVWNRLGVADLSATGTPSATTFLRGDNTWAAPPGGTVPDATTTVKGIVELATTAEATTGTDTVRAVTPAGVKAVADGKAAAAHNHAVTDLTATGTRDATTVLHGDNTWKVPAGGGGGGGNYTSVIDFGVGTGRTAAQNNTAFAAAVAAGVPLFVPPASSPYLISAPIDLRGKTGATLLGGDPEHTIIRQTTSNVPIIRLGGGAAGQIRSQKVEGLRLEYATEQPKTNTAANAIELDRVFMARLDRLIIYRAARGIHAATSDDGGGVMKAYVFSSHLSNIQVTNYSHTAINLESTGNTSSTGNVVENVYTIAVKDDGSTNTVERAISYFGHDATILRNINVERAKFAGAPVFFNVVKNALVDALHFEGITPTGWGMGLVTLSGPVSRLALRGMDVHICDFPVAGDRLPIFQVDNSTELDVYGLHTTGNTRGAPEVPLFHTYDMATGSVRLRGYESHDGLVTHESLGFPTTAQFPVIKQINDDMRHWQEAGKHVTFGTAAPTTGTWAVGDKRWRTNPAASQPMGWVCTAAGTPGTWKAMPNLAA